MNEIVHYVNWLALGVHFENGPSQVPAQQSSDSQWPVHSANGTKCLGKSSPSRTERQPR